MNGSQRATFVVVRKFCYVQEKEDEEMAFKSRDQILNQCETPR